MAFSTAAAQTAAAPAAVPLRPAVSRVPPTVSSSQLPPSPQYTLTAAYAIPTTNAAWAARRASRGTGGPDAAR